MKIILLLLFFSNPMWPSTIQANIDLVASERAVAVQMAEIINRDCIVSLIAMRNPITDTDKENRVYSSCFHVRINTQLKSRLVHNLPQRVLLHREDPENRIWLSNRIEACFFRRVCQKAGAKFPESLIKSSANAASKAISYGNGINIINYVCGRSHAFANILYRWNELESGALSVERDLGKLCRWDKPRPALRDHGFTRNIISIFRRSELLLYQGNLALGRQEKQNSCNKQETRKKGDPVVICKPQKSYPLTRFLFFFLIGPVVGSALALRFISEVRDSSIPRFIAFFVLGSGSGYILFYAVGWI